MNFIWKFFDSLGQYIPESIGNVTVLGKSIYYWAGDACGVVYNNLMLIIAMAFVALVWRVLRLEFFSRRS